MVFLRRAMVIREPANTFRHAFCGARCVARFQQEPRNVKVFPVVKEIGGKR